MSDDNRYPLDDQVTVNDGGDNYDENDPENFSDIDTMMEMATGDVPNPGEAYSISEEMEDDTKAL